MVENISHTSRLILLINPLVLGIKLVQNAKLRGVMMMAAEVVKAVRLTDRAVLAPASLQMKLLIFPPGQAATNTIPKAKLG